jgi:hypothetical protein
VGKRTYVFYLAFRSQQRIHPQSENVKKTKSSSNTGGFRMYALERRALIKAVRQPEWERGVCLQIPES